ncbi:MAG: DUF4091 domain-containing protein [Labilithrix sp.]|nr:DUF4091 domain-containing protein [Labilithrix sp.]
MARRPRAVCFMMMTSVLLASCGGCGDDAHGPDGEGDGGGSPPAPVCTDCTPSGPMTFRLPSPAGATLWTTPTMEKVVREAAPPTTTGDAIQMYAAKNELEPMQIVVRADADASVTLSMPPLAQGGATIPRIEIRRVGYVRITQPSDGTSIKSGFVPDPLEPTTFGATEALKAGENQPFWITVYVPPDAAAGDYTSTLAITIDGRTQDVPVKLHVYDFALPKKIGFDGNWNLSFEALGGSASLAAVERLKTWLFEHRLVPSAVAWPAGLNYNGGIAYDCASGTFKEEANDYDFSRLGPKYIDGVGWNGQGFPSFQAMTFVDNATPRPQTFCGVDRGSDHFGTPAYDAAWSKLLGAIDGMLEARAAQGWPDKAYYYVQNEPQNQADYDVAAHLAYVAKTAAPRLRIAISEEPKPEIAENPRGQGKSYDLWWADLSHFEPSYAKTRQAKGEQVWWYFLYGDRPPFFNPIAIDHSGIESRIAFFAAWKYRIRGFAYYSVTGWGADPYANPRPEGTDMNGDGFLLYPPKGEEMVSSIRWELLREGEEDFEYLLMLAGGNVPKTPDDAAGCDASAASAVSSPTAYTRDTSALQHLRNQLGLRIEGKVNGCPVLASSAPGGRKRGAYYVNFQDPAGEPSASPLTVDGHEWMKIGWNAYDPKLGYGWAGPNIGKPDVMLYQYLAGAPVSELQKSIIYDDYGRTDTFTFDIENGAYAVTVSIGWHGKTYAKQRVVVEGKVLYADAETTPAAPYKVETIEVDVTDGNITLEAGQMNEYTMLNWMSVVPKP